MFLKQSTGSQSRIIGPFVDDTDFKTAETGLTIANTDIKLMANGAASANKNSGGGTHRANGCYGVTFDATDTATVGELEVSVVMSGALPVFHKFFVLEEAVYDALFGASAAGYVADQPVNATKLGGTTQTGADVGSLVAKFTGMTNLPQWLGALAGKQTPNSTAQTEIRATGAGSGTYDATTDSQEATRDNMGTAQSGDSYARLGAPAGPSVSADIAAVKSDTAAILVDTGTTLDAKLDAIDDYIDTEIGAIKAKTDNLPASPAAVGSAMTLADDSITAAKFDESTAFPLKAADAGSTYVARTGADSDTLETLSDQIDSVTGGGGGGPTAEDIAAAVWDEDLTTHTDADSAGKILSDVLVDTAQIASLNDLDEADIRAAVGLASANLDTQLSTIDSVVDAIKAVTDNLPNSGALTDLLADVAAILVDTGTTLDAKLDAIDNYIDTEIAAILEDTGDRKSVV